MDIKSAWLSKINWTQAITFLAMILAVFGIDLDEGTRNALMTGIVSVSAVVTWVFRTWFTNSITTATAKREGTL